MTAPVHIELPADHRQLVLRVLDAHLPRGTKAWVFGSRATGRARRYSDLDLAIDAGRRLSLDELAELAEAFSDSDLPYKVDLIDWLNIDDRWRQTITAERVALTAAAHPDGSDLSQSEGCPPGG
jgi:predicted nucleotidyltransferase